MNAFEFIRYELKDHTGWLVLDRPPVNALSRAMVAELHAATREINADAASSTLRALVLTANGKHFCAGADLKERRDIPARQVASVVQELRDMTSSIAGIAVPVIAAIRGTAVGGGMEIALAADMRILAKSARMGLRETSLGIIPGAGGTQRLPRLIGRSAAMLWITTARLFSAEECLRYGVANQVVQEDDLLPKARALAEEIAANGPIAVRAAKKAVSLGLEVPLARGLQIEGECYAETIDSEDRLEALRAFAEKRPPRFRGK